MISSQRNPENLSTRLPADFIQRIVYFYKRFKGIYRHCYQLMQEIMSQKGEVAKVQELRRSVDAELEHLNAYKDECRKNAAGALDRWDKFLKVFQSLELMHASIRHNMVILQERFRT